MSDNHRNGGRLLVDCLLNLGAEKAFGVPGESYLAVLDAMHDTRGSFDFVVCRNEGGAAYMAAAWGKLTGEPGICMVTRGPGASNAAIGIHTAMQDSSPMILFVGQVATGMKGREAFQEIDYRAMYGTTAKWVIEIDQVDRVPELVSRAWITALSGRPGPVVVALPEDMLAAMSVRPPCRKVRIPQAAPSSGDMEALTALLAAARQPLVIAGGGGWSAEARAGLKQFAEANDLPVIVSFRCQDTIDNHSSSYCGDASFGMAPYVRNLISEADLIVALGIRFGEITTDGYSLLDVPNPKQKLVHIHPSDRELGKVYAADLPIHAAMAPMCRALTGLSVKPHWADWRVGARAAHEDFLDAPAQASPVDMVEVCRQLRPKLADDAIITNGAGNFSIWPNKFIAYGPKQRLLAPQSGSMGYGIPAAVAAKVKYPGRQVICFAGDGDFQMNGQELATARQAGACPVVLVINNGTYGTIRMHQEREFPARVCGTDLVNPDFAALARAYGLHGERVETTGDFAAAFDRALHAEAGAVLDLNVAAEAITPRMTLSELRANSLAAKG